MVKDATGEALEGVVTAELASIDEVVAGSVNDPPRTSVC